MSLLCACNFLYVPACLSLTRSTYVSSTQSSSSIKWCPFLLHLTPQLGGYKTHWGGMVSPLPEESWALSAPHAKHQAKGWWDISESLGFAPPWEDCEKGTGSLSLSGEDGSRVCPSLFHRHLRTKKILKKLTGKWSATQISPCQVQVKPANLSFLVQGKLERFQSKCFII